MKTLLLTLVAFLALTSQAKADHVEDQTFLSTAGALAQAQSQPVFDKQTNQSQLTDEQFAKLTEAAKAQAEIWGDTILEGDYEADGKTELDHVDALTLNNQLVAYRIVYSERSWDTSTCSSNNLNECEEGRIVETSFVSPDMTSYTRDMQNLADFKSK